MSKLINITDINGVKLNTSGKYCDDDIQVQIDDKTKANIVSENIKQGVTILGVEGSVVASDGIDYIKAWASGKNLTLENPIDLYSESVEIVGQWSFRENNNIRSVNFPNAKELYESAFYKCKKLTNVNLPNVTNFYGLNVFMFSGLVEANFPSLENIETTQAFYGCVSLKSGKFNVLSSIPKYTFYNCTSLTDLYFGYQSVVTLIDAASAFGGIEKINVHVRPGLDLATQYASATNWSSLITAGTITILEDYTDD